MFYRLRRDAKLVQFQFSEKPASYFPESAQGNALRYGYGKNDLSPRNRMRRLICISLLRGVTLRCIKTNR
jgi:hypothetical protein